MRLRTFLTLSATFLGFVGILAAAALVWTTSVLGQATGQLHVVIESIRAAEELEIELLLHERDLERAEADGRSPLGTREEIEKWLQRAEENAGSEEERTLFETVNAQALAYLDAPTAQRQNALRVALESADALAKFNVEEARRLRARAEQVDRLASALGLIAAGLLLTGIAGVLVAARRHLYGPLLQLRNAISEYKHGQRDRRARDDGPEELREIAVEFNDMAETLSRQEQARLQFIAGVAHDLKNPLQALKMSAGLLARRTGAPPGDKAADLTQKISRQADRLTRMVEDLLDRSRIEAGALELLPERCDLTELASEVVALHQATTQIHSLQLDAPPEPVVAHCDPGRMNQVLTNLVNNAIKYSPNGGEIRVGLRSAGDQAVITVSDPGVGIPPGEVERIFEPFRRSDATRAEIPGIGLGLSVARRIVRAHGGEIRAESTPGKGTVFTVELPDSPLQ